jgi:hypothetical protein
MVESAIATSPLAIITSAIANNPNKLPRTIPARMMTLLVSQPAIRGRRL